MVFLLIVLLFISWFALFALSLELVLLKKKLISEKSSSSKMASSLRVNNGSSKSNLLNTSSTLKNEKFELPSFFQGDKLPGVWYLITSNELSSENSSCLVNWLKKSQKGFYPIVYSKNINLKLNLIILDIETNETQLLIGFYFTALNVFVQFVINSNDNFETQKKFIEIITTFFVYLQQLSRDKQTLLKNNVNQKIADLTIPILVGYNLNNFDLPVLQVFCQNKTSLANPVLEARAFAKNLLTGNDKKDYNNFSPLMVDFFMVDIFWETGKRLKDWIPILNQAQFEDKNCFPPLKSKNWENKYKRVSGTKLIQWLEYNRNDLNATYYLCVYNNNLINFIFPRLTLFLNNLNDQSLIVLLRTRYLKNIEFTKN